MFFVFALLLFAFLLFAASSFFEMVGSGLCIALYTYLSGNRRYYSPKNIEVVKMIIYLLKKQGLTINGAIKLMDSMVIGLDDTKVSSIKTDYYKKNILKKIKVISDRIKKLNG